LSPWRKLLLGPSGSAPRRACGKNVSVEPLRSTLVILPLSVYIVSLAASKPHGSRHEPRYDRPQPDFPPPR
jgi:hypothetical protein